MQLMDPIPAWPFHGLTPGAYNLIVADPPWQFQLWSEKGNAKSASAKYEVQSMDWVRALPVAELAQKDCLLLCWVVAPLLPECLKTIEMWGFKYRTYMHWTKVHASGEAAMGTGFRVRTMGELVILATIGSPKHSPFPGNFKGIRREHSRKPERFYEVVDLYCSGLTNRVDLFARQSRSWWHTWGLEATKFDREPVTLCANTITQS